MSVSKTLRTRARAMLIAAIVSGLFCGAALFGSAGRWYPVHTFFALAVMTCAACALVCYFLAARARSQVRQALPSVVVGPPRVESRRPVRTPVAARPRPARPAVAPVTHPQVTHQVSHPRPMPALTAHEQR